MHYITGTTNSEYLINGVLLPKRSYTERELQAGRRLIVALKDDDYDKLKGNRTFTDLIGRGILLDTSTPPTERLDISDQVRELKRELAALQAEYDEFKENAIEEVTALNEQIGRLESV